MSVYDEKNPAFAFLQKGREIVTEKEFQELNTKANGRIEKIEALSDAEESLIGEIENGRQVHFQQFLYEFHTEEKISQIEKRLEKMYAEYPALRTGYITHDTGKRLKIILKSAHVKIPVRDITEQSTEEQIMLLKSTVAAEERKGYRPDRNHIMHLQIFKRSDVDFVILLSLCECSELNKKGNEILEYLFGIEQEEKLETLIKYRKEKVSRLQSQLYWKELLLPLPKPIAMKEPQKVTEKEHREVETFLLDQETKKLLAEYQKKHGIDMKTIFLTVWGMLICQYFKRREILIGNLHEQGELKLIPIKLQYSDKIQTLFASVQKQVEQENVFDSCSLEDLEKLLDFDAKAYFSIRHNFLNMSEIDYMLQQNTSGGKVLTYGSHINRNAPMLIYYNLYAKEISMQYVYMREWLGDINIEKMHKTFIKFLKSVLTTAEDETAVQLDFEELKKKEVAYKTILTAQKALYLKECGVFEALSSDELLTFGGECQLRGLLAGDVICNERMQLDSLYIIGEGMLEASKMDLNGYVKLVQLLKKQEVFGMESVISQNTANVSYTVSSDSARIVEIPVSILRRQIARHPDILEKLLELQTKNLHKFQRLWILN